MRLAPWIWPVAALGCAGLAWAVHVPHVVPLWHVAVSLVCVGLYAIDKQAARAGQRRVPEAALLAWSLVGGWPGALVAQRLFRHKTAKASFQTAFWLTAAVHVAVTAAVLTRPG